MERGGLALRIVAIARSLIGNYTGSPGLVAVLGCTFFAALSGSGPATTAAIGAVMIPAMIRDRDHPAFGGAIAASGCALASLDPSEQSDGYSCIVSDKPDTQIVLGGNHPGHHCERAVDAVYLDDRERRGDVGEQHPFSWAEVAHAIWDGKWAVGAPFIILGGIYSELYTNRSGFGLRRSMPLSLVRLYTGNSALAVFWAGTKITAMISGAVLIIVGPAKAFGELMSLMDAPDLIGAFLSDDTDSRFVLIMVMSLILIITGMFLESIAQIILLTPLMLPIAVSVCIILSYLASLW